MPRPFIFATDTTLYHPAEGARVFPAGETDPGPMWTEKPGGEPAGSATVAQALKDLIKAQAQNEALQGNLATAQLALDESAKTREAALAKVADLEQQVVAAKGAQADAEALATQYMRERDEARQEPKKAG